jgi:hypothetical protein
MRGAFAGEVPPVPATHLLAPFARYVGPFYKQPESE